MDHRFDLAAAPPPVRDPDAYGGADALSVVPTQTGLTSWEQSKLVERWYLALPRFSSVRRLYFFSRLPQRLFAAVCRMDGLEALYIKWSGIKRLDDIGQLGHLRLLHMGSSPQVESIEPLSSLQSLEVLELESLRRITDLSALAPLTRLRSLTLEGGMSTVWHVDTLKPIARLIALESLSLIALRVRDESLAPVSQLSGLRHLRLSNYFPVEQYALLAAKLPEVQPPITAIFARTTNNLKCRRCSESTMVLPTGNGSHWLCAECDSAKVAEKTKEFDQLVCAHAQHAHPADCGAREVDSG